MAARENCEGDSTPPCDGIERAIGRIGDAAEIVSVVVHLRRRVLRSQVCRARPPQVPKDRDKPRNSVKQSFHHVRPSLHTRPSGSTTDQAKAGEPRGTPRSAPPTANPRSALFLRISVRAVVPSSSDANGSAPSSSSRGTTRDSPARPDEGRSSRSGFSRRCRRLRRPGPG